MRAFWISGLWRTGGGSPVLLRAELTLTERELCVPPPGTSGPFSGSPLDRSATQALLPHFTDGQTKVQEVKSFGAHTRAYLSVRFFNFFFFQINF